MCVWNLEGRGKGGGGRGVVVIHMGSRWVWTRKAGVNGGVTDE